MDIRRLVLGSVLGVVLQSPALAEPGEGPSRHHPHQDPYYKMFDHQKRHDYQKERGYKKINGYQPGAVTKSVFYDYAKVVSVRPVIRTVRVDEPHRYCWEERVHRPSHRKSYTPLIVGGLLGAVIGNQVGGGTGNDLLTVGGVILGASIGHDLAERSLSHGYHSGMEERCETVHDYHEERHIDGYDVRYVYNGRSFVRRMDHPPGRKIRVRVDVTPEA